MKRPSFRPPPFEFLRRYLFQQISGRERGFAARSLAPRAPPTPPRPTATPRAMRFKTMFNGYSLAFSPFFENRLAVTTSQNFGIIGNGQQYVLDVVPGQGLREVARFETADGLYDCCWSEENENVLVSASGDGSVKVWDVASGPRANPLRSFEEHTHEVYAVSWNQVRRDVLPVRVVGRHGEAGPWIKPRTGRTRRSRSGRSRSTRTASTPRCGARSTRTCSPRRPGTAP